MTQEQRSWPDWLETLRPDEVTRKRIERAVLSRAAPLLAARRREGTWDVTAGWADVLVPVAAAATAFFVALALSAGGGAPATAVDGPAPRIEELVEYEPDASPPAVLTRGSEPDMDAVLEAAISYRTVENTPVENP